MAIPWQLPLGLSAMQALSCPLSGVKFSDVGRTLWTFLLLSWNQIRFQTKLMKSRALKLTPTLGIPWHCCGVLKPQREGKANASVSGRKGSVLLSSSRQMGVANYSPEDTDGVDHGDGLFAKGRNRSPCSIQCLPQGQQLRKMMLNPTSLQRGNRLKQD